MRRIVCGLSLLLALSLSASATDYITGESNLTSPRSNFTGCVGFGATVGASAPVFNATGVGRWVVAGNSATHTVSIDNSAGTALSSVSIATSGATAGQFKNAALTFPLPLLPNIEYWMLSSETSGGDQWYDDNTTITHTADFTHDGSFFQAACTGAPTPNLGTPAEYVPTQLQYAQPCSGVSYGSFTCSYTGSHESGLGVQDAAVTLTVSAGDWLEVWGQACNDASCAAPFSGTLSVSSSCGDTFTQFPSPFPKAFAVGGLDVTLTGWVAKATCNGTDTVTVHSSTATVDFVLNYAYGWTAGWPASSPIDTATAAAASGTTANPSVTSAAATSVANELVLTFGFLSAGALTGAPGSGYAFGDAFNGAEAQGYKELTVSGATAFQTANVTAGATTWFLGMVTIKPPGGGGTPATMPPAIF